MTPSELAKVREALESIRCHAIDDQGNVACNVDGYICNEDQPIRCPDDCSTGHVHGINDYARMILDEVKKLVSILDREAGRKTRTAYWFEWLSSEGWCRNYLFHDRESAEKYAATVTQFQTRIIEVTESWEEPTT